MAARRLCTTSHAFGLALYLTRLEASTIYAQMWDGPVGVDVHDAMVVTFENGAIGAINGASSHESKPNVEWEVGIFGSRGQLQLDSVTADVHLGPSTETSTAPLCRPTPVDTTPRGRG